MEESGLDQVLNDWIVSFTASEMQGCSAIVVTLANVLVSLDLLLPIVVVELDIVMHDNVHSFFDFDKITIATVSQQNVVVVLNMSRE